MSSKHIDLIGFNETRLDLNINDNMINLINLIGYNIIRKDRSRNGGGQDLIHTKLEAVCVGIIKPYSRPFLFTTIYLLQIQHVISLKVLRNLI